MTLILCILSYIFGAFSIFIIFAPEIHKICCPDIQAQDNQTEDDMTYRIEVVKGKKQWYWRIMHRNGNILAHSETYSSREKAVRTAKNLHETFKRNTCGFSII